MTHQDLRKSRILHLKKFISDNNAVGLGIEAEELIAILSINQGVSRRTAEEYLQCLLIAGEVINKNGVLWIPKLYHECKDLDKAEGKDRVEEFFEQQEIQDGI